MGSTGATLSGSYSGASSTPTAIGFKYRTESGNLTQSVDATDNNGSLSATLTGLTAGTTYYYKAFVTVSGTGDYASQSQTFYGSEYSFTTKAVATASVSNAAASSVTSSSAQLNGSFSGASGSIYETGFYWGTAANSLTNQVTTDGSNAASGSFSCTIGGQTPLSASTTYYYKAYVLEYDEASDDYVEHLASSAQSFTTQAVAQQQVWQTYLSDYGMPDVSGITNGLRQSGTNSDRDDKWYSVNTTSSSRQIAIHTYTDGAPNDAETVNYVVLYDGDKHAPVWTAHTMNNTTWPRNGVGRNESWGNDPAVSLTQQSGVSGYSKGHLVASNYRQSTVAQNKQTFYYSNQAPQYQNSFNDGVWSDLENRVVAVSTTGTTMLYVITGVLYEGSYSTVSGVAIPSHFYKCIMRCTFSGETMTGAQGIAFVYTNEAHSGNYYDSGFVTSIDAIEQRAGFDFFAGVPTSIQNAAESNTSHSWFTGQ